MRYLAIIIAFLLPIIYNAQAHLGVTVAELKQMYPSNTLEPGTSGDGVRYVTTRMNLGDFCYYFKEGSNRTSLCLQLPSNMVNLNTQVEIYNKKCAVTSKKTWTAYLEGGNMMYIKLEYDDELQVYKFIYSGHEI